MTTIQQSKIQFESFNLLESIVLICDEQGEVIFANKAVNTILGYDQNELLGNNWWEKTETLNSLGKEKRKSVVAGMAKGIIPIDSSQLELTPIKRKDGKIVWTQWNSSRIDGNLLIGVAQDISKNKESEEELKRSNENARVLSEIGRQISSTRSITKLIDQVYENVNRLMDATAFGVGLIDKETNRLNFPRLIEKGIVLENAGYDLNDNSRLAVLCVKEEKEIIINDFDNEIKNYTSVKSAPVAGESSQSIIYLPLKLKEEVIGVVTVQSFEKSAYDNYQLNLLRNLSVYIANAIENAHLYETMEEQIKQRTQEVLSQKEKLETNYANTKLLSEIGQQMASSLSFEEIFITLHQNVNKVMNAEMFGVRIYHPESNMIEYKYEMEGGQREPVVFVPMNDDDNYSVWCIKNKKEIFINDNKKEYKKYVKEIKVPMGQMPDSLLFYPMIVNDKVIGVITVQCMEKNAYNDYHLDVLKTLASYAGSALHNAALYETLEIKVKDRTLALEEKNKSIMDSINYAKRIQDVILPEKKIIDKFLKDYFIFYQPKDIISGDFYLIDEIITSNGERLYSMIIGDCTGHGVPGGMLSMLCSSLIRQSFKMKEINSPADSLKFVSNQLQSLFKGDSNKRTLMDGMDAAYCVLNKEKKVLHFAGANNSLLIVRDNNIMEIKGDKQSVSYTENFIPFNLHEIKIQENDILYLFTDGFPDQFGGENDKKYKKNQFKEFLLSIHKKPMEKQYELVNAEFTAWKGNNEQTDDICILGVRI
jgi:PAS domain S-box-containing protein